MISVLARESVNTGRQFEVDLARVLAMFTMVLVHLFEFADWLPVLGMPASVVIEFAGGPLSAPVFMTAMGIGGAYSKNRSPAGLAARGKRLVRQGYVLNFWRLGLAYLVLYTLSGEDSWLKAAVEHMLVLDILQFAGAAFLLFALLEKLRAKPWQILAVAVLLEAVATVAKPVVPQAMLPAGVIGYLLYQSPTTCFPLFSWFIYPAAGYCFAQWLLRAADKTRLYARCLLFCSGFFVVFTAVLLALGYKVSDIFLGHGYYAQGLVHAAWILPICGMLYSLLYFASRGAGAGRPRALIQFISEEVNDIYICQWVIIAWFGQFVLGHMEKTPLLFDLIVAGVIVLSALLAYARQRLGGWLKEIMT